MKKNVYAFTTGFVSGVVIGVCIKKLRSKKQVVVANEQPQPQSRVANVPKEATQKMAQMRADGMTLAVILKEEGSKYGLKHQAEVSRVIKRTKIQIVETI